MISMMGKTLRISVLADAVRARSHSTILLKRFLSVGIVAALSAPCLAADITAITVPSVSILATSTIASRETV
ncbi:hypothetical protein KSX_19710 [Ktedonospora formicarum]|uniref:Uncharacterized protein n=1 Tax=Ktedonospora formicarum TaxID=2778364 RepID=A0A8J3HZE6_9CHLR|nr:hypothetical protein KSX_19710 [Ktedonospora formicarum]